eukprot:Protomagalhaensia_wolfi_Nauph_80__2309@NODE_250_length_3057_cov_227_021537_g186_i0_p2_GENE_NODE_250_length_3057_cov_227_021537_g186_i0NODE_250_length_3057_cov_227_021537_g186_i0_p2_ORF_typecomplete_len204_score24_61NUDIX/PF00293_28/8_5e13_NODE_250_length_3057_cov_227_021537_g186_i06071218
MKSKTLLPMVMPLESSGTPKVLSSLYGAVAAVSGGALEVSSGFILMRQRQQTENPFPLPFTSTAEALLICRSGDLEIPKGHVEGTETLLETAQRELMEETGIMNNVLVGPEIGVARYMVRSTRPPYNGQVIPKEVHYFSAFLREGEQITFGAREQATKKLQWISMKEWEMAKFRTQEQKSFVGKALRESDVLLQVALQDSRCN